MPVKHWDTSDAFLLFVAATLAGCMGDPYYDSYTRKRPQTEDLVGTYFLAADSCKFVSEQGHYSLTNASITLTSNGGVIITNIPDWWLTFGKSKGGFDSGTGTWEIGRHQEWWAISVSFPSTAEFSSLQHDLRGFGTQLFIIGEKPPYTIHLDVGDPDNGQSMEFTKSSR